MTKTAVDIFSGAGGLSIGAEMAGIKTVLAVEFDKHAANSFTKNHKKATVINKDIRNVIPLEFTDKNPFILMGGPPCQGFSIANTKTRNLDNPNNWMFKEYYRFLKELEPEWFLFENVEGFKSFDKGKFAVNIEKEFKKLGYETNSAVLTASDFGVPQKRNRFFIIGNKRGIKFDFKALRKKSKVSVGEALSDLPSLSNGEHREECSYTKDASTPYLKNMRKKSNKPMQNTVSRNRDYVIERYKYIRPGKNWQDIPKELMGNYTNTKNMHSGIYKRLDPEQPSVVIANYRKSMLIHPYEDRGLSLREAARLQSFPDHFVFEGPLSYKQQQIGNAVPPLLAKAIFSKILKY
ncbi:MAG: DNA cytosine methyltransferase [Campylobacterales bacterium]|nr:DNA cytosine methyltransferase [Campylobacterales bacterium]